MRSGLLVERIAKTVATVQNRVDEDRKESCGSDERYGSDAAHSPSASDDDNNDEEEAMSPEDPGTLGGGAEAEATAAACPLAHSRDDQPVHSDPVLDQVNMDFYTDEALCAREMLKQSAILRNEINAQWWSGLVRTVHDPDMFDKNEYVFLMSKIYRVLVPEVYRKCSLKKLVRLLEHEWEEDLAAFGLPVTTELLNQAPFFSMIFSLADVWVNSISEHEYCGFLGKLRKSVFDHEYVELRERVAEMRLQYEKEIRQAGDRRKAQLEANALIRERTARMKFEARKPPQRRQLLQASKVDLNTGQVHGVVRL